MPKINAEQLKIHQEFVINGLKIKIEAIIPCSKPNVQHLRCSSSDNREVYIIHFFNAYPLINFRALQETLLLANLSNLEKEKKALCIISGDVPKKYTLYLPRHMETWLLGEVPNDVFYDTKSVKLKELALPEPKKVFIDKLKAAIEVNKVVEGALPPLLTEMAPKSQVEGDFEPNKKQKLESGEGKSTTAAVNNGVQDKQSSTKPNLVNGQQQNPLQGHI